VNIAASLLVLFVILNIILSYFVDYYHPVRRFVDQIVEPMLSPIRRVVPLIGMFDISPLILILLVYGLQSALINLLSALR
jgi:YggT family protein